MSILESLRSLGSRRQRKVARDLSIQALDGLQHVSALAPDLFGEALYERILSTRFGVDGTRARDLVEGARESYAEWPVAREVRLTDVVHYLVSERCLNEQELDQTHWIHGKIGEIVRSVIPQHL